MRGSRWPASLAALESVGVCRLWEEWFSTFSQWRIYQSAQVQPAQTNEVFKWDSLSNARQKDQTELLYNAEANRLTQVSDIAAPYTVRHTYAYDAAGFVTSRDGVALGYDATGAIASIGTVAAFDHDLSGRPVSRTLNGVTKNFRFGGAMAFDSAGEPLVLDLGEVVINVNSTAATRYRHTDFRGNVMFVSKGDGAIVGRASYRGFGTHTVTGKLGERSFAGGFEVSGLGLVVLGPRVLDSDTGRFLSQDPVFNAVNLYAYAQGNPVLMWDPTGRSNGPLVYTAASLAGGVGAATGVALLIAFAPFSVPVTVTGVLAVVALEAIIAQTGSTTAVLVTWGAWSAFDSNAPAPSAGDILGPIGTLAQFASGAPDLGGVSTASSIASDIGNTMNASNAAQVRTIELYGIDPVTGVATRVAIGSDISSGGGFFSSSVNFSFSSMY